MKKTEPTKLKYLLIFFLLYPAVNVHSTQLPTDNLTVFCQLTSNIVDSVVNRIEPDSANIVKINSLNKENQCNWVIENEFVKKLMFSGVDILINGTSNTKFNYLIEFSIVNFNVKYFPTSEKKTVQRKQIVSLDIRALHGQNGKVIFVKRFTKQFVDSVRIENISKIENQNFPFTAAKIPVNLGLKKYLEPFIVLLTSVGIIYMFFSLRSK